MLLLIIFFTAFDKRNL